MVGFMYDVRSAESARSATSGSTRSASRSAPKVTLKMRQVAQPAVQPADQPDVRAASPAGAPTWSRRASRWHRSRSTYYGQSGRVAARWPRSTDRQPEPACGRAARCTCRPAMNSPRRARDGCTDSEALDTGMRRRPGIKVGTADRACRSSPTITRQDRAGRRRHPPAPAGHVRDHVSRRGREGASATPTSRSAPAVEISGAKAGDSRRRTLINGEVTSIEAICVDGTILSVVRGYEKAHRLQRARRTKTFLNMKDSDIARKVAQRRRPDDRHDRLVQDDARTHGADRTRRTGSS